MEEIRLVRAPVNGDEKSLVETTVENRTVQDLPSAEENVNPLSEFVLWMASAADSIPPWGTDVHNRDAELRKFWHTEPYLAGAVYSTSIRNAGFKFKLEGPPRTTNAVQKSIFDLANFGQGWFDFITQFCVDFYTQDNGAFIELIRTANRPDAPIVGIALLDSFRCHRTGDPDFPVFYTDRKGLRHKLAYYQVVAVTEFPSPIERMHGVQYCAVTRVLRAAQILKNIEVYKDEKVSGRFHRALHLVSGIQTKQVTDAMSQNQENADNMGASRYIQPVVIGSIDPTANVDHVQIDLASLPDAFDEETTLRWYIAALANGLGGDYQDFAPLPGGNLGTAQQSEILHRKTRGKGPAMFMNIIEHVMNTYILPDSVVFSYEEQDLEAAKEQARLAAIRAKERADRIASGEITPAMARKLAVEDGDLTEEQLEEIEKEIAKQKRELEQQMQQEVSETSEPMPRADSPDDVEREVAGRTPGDIQGRNPDRDS